MLEGSIITLKLIYSAQQAGEVSNKVTSNMVKHLRQESMHLEQLKKKDCDLIESEMRCVSGAVISRDC